MCRHTRLRPGLVAIATAGIPAGVTLLFAAAVAIADPAAALEGRYSLPEEKGVVEIRRIGKRFSGTVVSYHVPGALDFKNPDPEKRKLPFVGVEMFSGFTFDPKTERWVDGTVYDGSSGRTYRCVLWFEAGENALLFARGYVGVPWLGRTQTFPRVLDGAERDRDAIFYSGVTRP